MNLNQDVSPLNLGSDVSFVPDRILDMGPMGGILSAMEAHPHRAWLVMAVDMPWMKASVLQHLMDHRRPLATATAFKETRGHFPEPLCAIYEPRAKSALYEFLGMGYRCPRKVLINSRTVLLDCPDPVALGNANTPEDIQGFVGGQGL